LHKHLLLLLQSLHNIHRNLQHTRHDFRRRQRQPLRQRDIRHTLRLVDLNEGQVLRGGGVFDVVACATRVSEFSDIEGVREEDIPALSGNTAVSPALKSKVRELEFPVKTVACASPEWKYSHSSDCMRVSVTSIAFPHVIASTYGWMPVQLPYALGLDHNVRACDGLRDWELRAVNLPPLARAARRQLGCVLEGAIHIAGVPCERACSARYGAIGSGLAGRAVENIRIWGRDLVEDRLWETKALG
jgi:hypothetical protein